MVDSAFDNLVHNEQGSINVDNPLNVMLFDTRDVRYDANDTLPNYVGINQASFNASTSSETWILFKFTYINDQVTRVQKQLNVAWDDRTTIW